MRRIAGHVMVIGGIVIGPPLCDEMAAGGLRSKVAFIGALVSIVTGLLVSFETRHSQGKGRR